MCIYVVIFCVGMFIFKGIFYIFRYIYNSCKKERLPSNKEVRKIINKFDEIACDNILISQNFIDAYKRHGTSQNLKEFYFYEIIYYTKISLSNINDLILNSKMCIGNSQNLNKVQLFRLENALKMLKEIYDFLEKEKSDIDSLLETSLHNEIAGIEYKLNNCYDSCENLKAELYN